ncbi:MAG: hypothetical protein GXO88_01065 [Chlorobi bacterium]|nr:hypothetical protein [Chlorobiota bacterium]
MIKTRLLYFSLVGMLLSFAVLRSIDGELQKGKSEYGIVGFELSHDSDTANAIVGYWTENDKLGQAFFSLGFDYLFILFYVAFLALWTSLMAGKFYSAIWRNIAYAIILLFILAGLLDAVENYSLMKFLNNADGGYWLIIAFYCASIKFGLIGLGALYNLGVLIGQKTIRV